MLERDVYGGSLQHADRSRTSPTYPDGITGADLARPARPAPTACGVTLEQAEVSGVEVFSRSRVVACSDGRAFSCGVVILAGGSRFRSLGIVGEGKFHGRGEIDCTPCDSGFYANKPVVVVGAGEYAVRDALHLAAMGANVMLLAPGPQLETPPRGLGTSGASPFDTSGVSASYDTPAVAVPFDTPGVAVRFNASVEALVGTDRLESVRCATGEHVPATGVAIRVGSAPNTEWLADLLDLDPDQRVPVKADLQTELPHVLAIGDLRSGAIERVASAIADATQAAATALKLLSS